MAGLSKANARRARAALDARLSKIEPASAYAVPQKGWIRAVRDALGMSAVQLGRRMKVSQAAVSDLERTEQLGTIQISSLVRAAEAMDCRLVYAFIPNGTLEETVRSQALRHIAGHAEATHQSMVLESQGDYALGTEDEAAIEQLMKSPRLWDEQ